MPLSFISPILHPLIPPPSSITGPHPFIQGQVLECPARALALVNALLGPDTHLHLPTALYVSDKQSVWLQLLQMQKNLKYTEAGDRDDVPNADG